MNDHAAPARPAVIEISVIRGRTNRLVPIEWLMLLRLARDHGWEPAGAVAFDHEGVELQRDHWYGLSPHFDITYRSIEGADARRLAIALQHAAHTVARESDAALIAAAEQPAHREPCQLPSPLDYFVEQGLAADWLEQLADDLNDNATILVHGDILYEWHNALARHTHQDDTGF